MGDKEFPVFICDDDPKQIDQIKNFLIAAEVMITDQDVKFTSSSASSFKAGLEYVGSHKLEGGIYFLDIELEDGEENESGFDLAEVIKKYDEKAQIIFVTSHADLSLITFKRRLGPVDYIVKTDDIEELRKRVVATLEVAIDNIEKYDYRKEMSFTYTIGRRIINIELPNVVYITTTPTPHKLLLIMTNGEAQFMGSIKKYSDDNPHLVRISQSCLANPRNITSVDFARKKAYFKNGDIQRLSRQFIPELRQAMAKVEAEREKKKQEQN